MATKEGQELMAEAGIAAPAVRTVQETADVSIERVGEQLEKRIALVERVHALIQRSINPETDIKRVGDNFRRTINFARKCFRIVGGSIAWWTDPTTGLKYKREAYTDAEGPWYAMTAACMYTTPWGETVEAFKRITSREPFFGEVDDAFRPASQVNEADILEMCVSEAFKSAVFTALGLPKDISPEELGRFGVNGAKAAGHTFDGARGRQGGSTDTQASGDLRAQIEVLCTKLYEAGWQPESGADLHSAADVLKAVTANPEKGWEGWRTFRAIKDTQLERIAKRLTEIWEGVGGPDGKDGGKDDLPL